MIFFNIYTYGVHIFDNRSFGVIRFVFRHVSETVVAQEPAHAGRHGRCRRHTPTIVIVNVSAVSSRLLRLSVIEIRLSRVVIGTRNVRIPLPTVRSPATVILLFRVENKKKTKQK